MEIPHAQLSPAALRSIIEDFVLREGTDYGEREYSLDDKVHHVEQQLKNGRASVVFDPESETTSILLK